MSEPSASPIIVPKCTARPFSTGSAPGSPRQTAHVSELRGSLKDSSQPQNIFVRVESWTWISRPMTGSYSLMAVPGGSSPRLAAVEPDRLLQRVGRGQQAVLVERPGRELEPDGEPAAEPGRDRDR